MVESINPPKQMKNLYYNLPSNDLKYWQIIQEKLSTPILDNQALLETINCFTNQSHPTLHLFDQFDSLNIVITEMNAEYKNFKFYENILPKLQQACLSMKDLFEETQQKINILPQNVNSSLKLTGKQVRCLLSHAFFNTLNTYLDQNNLKKHETSFGNISFYRLYGIPHSESVERLKCLLYYFYEVFNEEPIEEALFIRRTLHESMLIDWENDENSITQEILFSDSMKIEESDAFMHVDFANKNLQIHCNIPSCTQEEVLFTIRPALYITLLIAETMAANEAIYMLGCKRYCNYKGYLNTFQFDGPYEEIHNSKMISGLIAIDSVVNYGNTEFTKVSIDRDLNKALLGFNGIDKEIEESNKKGEIYLNIKKISTGNWGCGAFCGNYILKFFQQAMAANVVKKNLDYSTFGDKEKCKNLRIIYERIKKSQLRIKDLYRILIEFKNDKESFSFNNYLKKVLKS